MDMTIISGIYYGSIELFIRMAPYLLFGFFFAGLLHIFISLDSIAKHLGKNNVASVIKAVLLGIPLPLCSCGVIPAAVLLRKKGASRSAVVSFLISTPITGIDSIFATFSLMGPFFTLFRVIASSVTAFVAGVAASFLPHSEPAQELADGAVKRRCCEDAPSSGFHVCRNRVSELFYYAFVELLGDIWKWLLIGVLIGGAIAYFVPETFIQRYVGSGWQALFLMLVAGIPMYVCATGSIPIAAALMMKGMSPGAALVFLLAGPATNAVTITVIAKELGRGATAVYLTSIAVMSLIFGALLDMLWRGGAMAAHEQMMGGEMLPRGVEVASAIILAALILYVAIRRAVNREL